MFCSKFLSSSGRVDIAVRSRSKSFNLFKLATLEGIAVIVSEPAKTILPKFGKLLILSVNSRITGSLPNDNEVTFSFKIAP